jgi:hypothetical protein
MAPKKTPHDHKQDITLATVMEKLMHIDKTNEAILVQAEKTNGRVKSLEIWRAYLIGGVVVITALIGWLTQLIQSQQ